MTDVRRLPDALKVRATLHGTQVAHDDTRRVLTFAEWDSEADAIGGGLAAAGLVPGDRVFLPISNANAVEMAIAVMAVLRAGGIAVPINTRLSATEVRDYAALTEPRFTIYNDAGPLTGLTVEQSWQVDAMPHDPASLPDQGSLDPLADAEILGTSGTTGKIKGVVVSHPDLLGGVTGIEQDRSRSTLHALPFSGSGGNLGTLVLPIKGGATCYTQPRFDPAGFLHLVAQKRPETVYLVPSMLRLILDLPDVATHDFLSVKWLMTGTAPLPQDSVRRAMALWPNARVLNSYGMSEGTFGMATRSRESVLKPGCIGPINPSMQVRDEHGNVAPVGVVGEIYGRQKYPRRYWRDEDATRENFVDGWTKSGDLGLVDEEGDLILVGRSKELIIRGGYNITPMEIETVLHAHAAVKDAAVVSIDHEVLGEDIGAAIVFATGASASIDDLRHWCALHLADNKVPRVFLILKELPLNQSNKVVKGELKPMLEAQAAANRSAGLRCALSAEASRIGDTK